MFRVTLRVMAATLAVLTVAGKASAFDGNKLSELCTLRSADAQGICIGYATAIGDAMSDRSSIVHGMKACIPNGATNSQLGAIMNQYIQQNPSVLHYEASYIVAAAYSKAFPCR